MIGLRISVCLLLLLSLLSCEVLHAQVWNKGSESLKRTRKKTERQGNRAKAWKDQILQWGLDSNYNYSLAAGAKLTTSGWSGGLVYLKQKKPGNKTVWQLYISEIKHEKEIKQQRNGDDYRELGKFRPFILGKIHYCYTLQLGYGKEQLLFPALLDGNMSVSFRYIIGPSLALMKPVYLNLIYTDYIPEAVSHIQSEQYENLNGEQFLNPGKILGADKWSKGLSEMKFIPGAFAEAAFILEPGRPKAFVKTILIGGQFAFYTQKITIMANRKAYPYQMCFFVGINIGKRWK